MTITAIKAFPLQLQLTTPFALNGVVLNRMPYTLVAVFSSEGIVGYGEAAPSDVTGETQQSVCAFVQRLQTAADGFQLTGRSIVQISDVEEIMNELHPPAGNPFYAGNTAAKAAVEQALLDACGKRNALPVYALFGAEKQAVHLSKSFGIQPVADTVEAAHKALNSGYDIIRFKIGQKNSGNLPGFRRDIEVIQQTAALIEKHGFGARVVADANMGFPDVAETVAFCRNVEGALAWLEQAMPAADIFAFGEVAAKTTVPQMADESLHSLQDAKNLIRAGGVQFFNIKLMKSGGLFMARKIAEEAARHSIDCQIGSMIETQVGAAPGCHAFSVIPGVVTTNLHGFSRLSSQYAAGIDFKDNHLLINDTPGFGLTIDLNQLLARLQTF